MAYARKVDGNQQAVVEAFRAAGASVLHLHTVGRGCPDLLVGVAGVDVQVEVKDGRRPPSERKLTKDEARHHLSWRGRNVEIVSSAEEAISLVTRLRAEVARGPH